MVRPMRHDSPTVSARDWRAAREGETHAAGRTSNTPESFIVGIGASGGLLAGAAIVFVTLIGVVSFNVWPSAAGISSSGGDVELSAVTPPGGDGEGGTTAPLSSASGQLASASVPTGAAGGDGGGDGGGGGGGGDGNGGAVGELDAGSPPPSGNTPATPPSSGGGSDNPPPGRGEPIDDDIPKVPSGRDDGRSHKDLPDIDLPIGNGHGKRPGHGNGHHKNPAQPVAPPAVPVPPSDSDDDDESDDDDRDDCRRGRSRSRDRDDDDDESSSPFTSSRSSSHSSGRSRGRGRSRGHRD
jgi:hypothetical protein